MWRQVEPNADNPDRGRQVLKRRKTLRRGYHIRKTVEGIAKKNTVHTEGSDLTKTKGELRHSIQTEQDR